MDKYSRIAKIALAAYFILILINIIQKDFSKALFHASVLAVLVAATILLKPQKTRSVAISLLVLLYLSSELIGAFGIILEATIFGPDKVFHFIGGALSALFGVSLFEGFQKNKLTFFIASLSFCVMIGAGWEVFEYVFFSVLRPDLINSLTYTDSILDIIADTLGGLFLLSMWIWKN